MYAAQQQNNADQQNSDHQGQRAFYDHDPHAPRVSYSLQLIFAFLSVISTF